LEKTTFLTAIEQIFAIFNRHLKWDDVMPKKELKSLFQRLRDHLPEGEASAQQKMLMDQISFHIHEDGSPDPVDPSIRTSVETLIEDIESDHPQSAAVARNILETLAAIGI
jgi:hypothetical protein